MPSLSDRLALPNFAMIKCTVIDGKTGKKQRRERDASFRDWKRWLWLSNKKKQLSVRRIEVVPKTQVSKNFNLLFESIDSSTFLRNK